MKIAYLITAFANFRHLERLIDSLDDENVEFYIHIDKKSEIPTDIKTAPNVHYIPRIKVWWGGYSHLQAIINLMKTAIKNDPDYFVVISGGDYPIKKPGELRALLEQGGNFMSISKGFSKAKPEARIKFFYFDAFDRRAKSRKTKLYFFAEKIIRQIYRKSNYPFKQVYHGSTWMALPRDSVRFLLDFIKNNPKYVQFFKTCWCPEECMFHTIIGNSELMKDVKHDITYADWTVKPGPGNITEKHLPLFHKFAEENSTKYFARKFSDSSKELTDYIEENLRK